MQVEISKPKINLGEQIFNCTIYGEENILRHMQKFRKMFATVPQKTYNLYTL